MQQKTPTEWIEQFTQYLIEKRRLRLKLPHTTIKIAIVNNITIDGIGITCVNEGYGSAATFTSIEEIEESPVESPIEDIECVHWIRAFASYLARERIVRIETHDSVIEQAQITCVMDFGACVTDVATDAETVAFFKEMAKIREV